MPMGISISRIFLLLVVLLLTLATAKADYAFPIQDPYYSTITAGLLKADDYDKESTSHDIKLKPLLERDAVP